jgi:hypothetical protein
VLSSLSQGARKTHCSPVTGASPVGRISVSMDSRGWMWDYIFFHRIHCISWISNSLEALYFVGNGLVLSSLSQGARKTFCSPVTGASPVGRISVSMDSRGWMWDYIRSSAPSRLRCRPCAPKARPNAAFNASSSTRYLAGEVYTGLMRPPARR